ncbi:hypothetical protein ACA910_015918 [Epithemia clementina (nom. ined.)]
MAKKKVLLMGKAHSGKTSMRSIIFANYLARDTTRLSPTLDVENHQVRFLGDLVLNLWDCGGQDAFFESYFERDRETIFRSVELLIYVFDIESNSTDIDFEHFRGVLQAIEENSPDARIFVLIHKMDLVVEEDRPAILKERRQLIAETCAECRVEHFQCFGTSIWDETLYKAWSEIVTKLIPNMGLLEKHLNRFCTLCDADEVVLFERATFLVIADATSDELLEDDDDYDDDPTFIVTTEQRDETEILPTGSENNGNHDQQQQQQQAQEGSEEITIMTPPPASSKPSKNNTARQRSRRRRRKTNQSGNPLDAHRFEKISNIVKQFKLSCGKAQSQFQGMQVRNSKFRAYIDAFTANTYIMVIVSNPAVQTQTTEWNIQQARPHFEKFIPRI